MAPGGPISPPLHPSSRIRAGIPNAMAPGGTTVSGAGHDLRFLLAGCSFQAGRAGDHGGCFLAADRLVGA
ncbi:MAG: hypothetical protein OXC58_09975, partial [Acidimicrobiaceae bacterium]|nr:hypothetical protein [Acidimicrobiaceae bacterium]